MEQLLYKFREISLRSSSTTCSACRSLSTSAARQASARPARRYIDPYAAAQARARKAANISRQADLGKAREEALGDPVRGKRTPFVDSFDVARPPPAGAYRASGIRTIDGAESAEAYAAGEHLNFSITPAELDSSLKRSQFWSGGSSEVTEADFPDALGIGADELSHSASPAGREAAHKTATEAIRRITSLANASSKERLDVNIKRCVSTFGRHNTDKHLPSKPLASEAFLAAQASGQADSLPAKTPRAGPDTGSSEVQIAILTARIRTLSQFVDGRGKMDKMNKRNLRVLVHRRQKLLKYLHRKERGGPRFKNVVEVLGLTPGMWEGEISLP